MKIESYLAVTNHAIDRMKERMGIVGFREIKKNVIAAWKSRQEISEEFLNSYLNFKKEGLETFYYRKHKGFIFCFQKKYVDVVLITVFLENKKIFKTKNESYSKKITEGNFRRYFLQDMRKIEGDELRRKNNARTRIDLFRKANKREMVDNTSMREAPRNRKISKRWNHGQAISRIRCGEQDELL